MSSTANMSVQRLPRRRLFGYSILLGAVIGVVFGFQAVAVSRWQDYRRISLGMSRQQALEVVERSDASHTGCGTLRGEKPEAVCRFEDPWRDYCIRFDPSTMRVIGKQFYFKSF
ncbi:MAG TPA: hypothetical protein VMT28_17415, partial [Terriglobales bacterium]|nr:hypothetical protein [Terriglobales bacterium]